MKRYKYCPMCARKLANRDIEGKSYLQCSGCGWVNYLNPVPAAACVAKNAKDEILLIKRSIEPEIGKWALPSGFIEFAETTEDAVLRELEEETGMKGTVERLLGVYTQPSKIYGWVLTVGYLVRVTGGRLKPSSDVSDVQFVKKVDISKIPFYSHRKMLKDVNSNG